MDKSLLPFTDPAWSADEISNFKGCVFYLNAKWGESPNEQCDIQAPSFDALNVSIGDCFQSVTAKGKRVVLSRVQRAPSKVSESPVVRLSNGIRVANFSSPHAFEFEDGSVLGQCDEDRVEYGSCGNRERVVACQTEDMAKYGIVYLTPKCTGVCEALLDETCERLDVDLVIVPLMLLRSLKSPPEKAVTIRRKERGGAISIDRFCK